MPARPAQTDRNARRAPTAARSALNCTVLSLLASAAALSGCTAPLDGSSSLEVVANVDVERYMGKWYEIAKYPNSFQDGCYAVTAEYELRDNGTVSVLNTCREADGRTLKSQIEGFATVADKSTNAKLTVYFFYPFGAPYWIIELDENYQYAVVGDPTRRFLWILSRTPALDPAIYEGILQRLPEKGYDPARLEPTPQFPEET